MTAADAGGGLYVDARVAEARSRASAMRMQQERRAKCDRGEVLAGGINGSSLCRNGFSYGKVKGAGGRGSRQGLNLIASRTDWRQLSVAQRNNRGWW